MQDPGLPCQYEECETLVVWRGTGRKPRFCAEHQLARYRKRDQRTRDAQGREARSACCEEAGRRGGRTSCEQHKTPGLGWMGQGAPRDDYAGAAGPVSTHATPTTVERPEDLSEAEQVIRTSPEGYMRADTLDASTDRDGFRSWGSRFADFKALTDWSMTECYTHNGAPIRVIGQPDLDVYGNPSTHPGAKPPVGLVWRGPDWPWAVEVEAVETEAVETEAVETEAVETEAVETEAA